MNSPLSNRDESPEVNAGLYEKVEPVINAMVTRFRARRPNAELETIFQSTPSAKVVFKSGPFRTEYNPSELYSSGLTPDQLLDRFIDRLHDGS